MQMKTGYLSLLGALLTGGVLLNANAHPGGSPLGAFDANSDGTITKEEFTTASATLAQDLQAKFLAKYDSVATGQTAGDGIITTAEATAVFEDRAADWLAHTLEVFDTNKDGDISSADTLKGRGRSGLKQLEEFDADDDGVISNEELIAAAEAKVAEQLAAFLKKYDSVPTGATAGDGVITAEESLAVFDAVVDEQIAKILERFDANDDGTVSAEEIAAVENSRPKAKGGPGGRPRP